MKKIPKEEVEVGMKGITEHNDEVEIVKTYVASQVSQDDFEDIKQHDVYTGNLPYGYNTWKHCLKYNDIEPNDVIVITKDIDGDDGVHIYGKSMMVPVSERWKKSKIMKDTNDKIGVFENITSDEIIGTTDGYGPNKSGKNAKKIYSNYDHPFHQDFDAIDHEAAAERHSLKMFDIKNKLFPKTAPSKLKPFKKLTPNQQIELEKNPEYAHHKLQKELHSKASEELSKPDQERLEKNYQERRKQELERLKKDRIYKKEIWKRIPIEERNQIEQYVTRLEQLKPYHPSDVPPGPSADNVSTIRRRLKNKIKQIEDKYYKEYMHLYDVITNPKTKNVNDKTGIFEHLKSFDKYNESKISVPSQTYFSSWKGLDLDEFIDVLKRHNCEYAKYTVDMLRFTLYFTYDTLKEQSDKVSRMNDLTGVIGNDNVISFEYEFTCDRDTASYYHTLEWRVGKELNYTNRAYCIDGDPITAIKALNRRLNKFFKNRVK